MSAKSGSKPSNKIQQDACGTLTKAKLADILADKVGLPKVDIEEIICSFCEIITKGVEQGQVVKLSGFGNFIPNDKKSRPGRNPITGEPVTITGRRVVTFRPGNKLRTAIMQYKNSAKSTDTKDS